VRGKPAPIVLNLLGERVSVEKDVLLVSPLLPEENVVRVINLHRAESVPKAIDLLCEVRAKVVRKNNLVPHAVRKIVTDKQAISHLHQKSGFVSFAVIPA
jgi:hypothetical protein